MDRAHDSMKTFPEAGQFRSSILPLSSFHTKIANPELSHISVLCGDVCCPAGSDQAQAGCQVRVKEFGGDETKVRLSRERVHCQTSRTMST